MDKVISYITHSSQLEAAQYSYSLEQLGLKVLIKSTTGSSTCPTLSPAGPEIELVTFSSQACFSNL